MALDAGVSQRWVLVAAEGEDGLVYLLGGGLLATDDVLPLLHVALIVKIVLAIRQAS